ncbi:MAG: NUDIX domain-containing protein [Acidimicrobiales bacterium]
MGGANGSPGEEMVEVVDGTGAVVGVATRAEVRAGNLRHRCTYIAVLDGHGRLVVHQRADWKDVYPGYWDLCFGGVCGVGEEWAESAARELAEEAGITGAELRELGPVAYDADDGHLVGRAYLARWSGPVTCPDGEVVAVDRIPLADLSDWLAGRSVCPDSAAVVAPLLLAALGPGDLAGRPV